jgi:hypothetical protein
MNLPDETPDFNHDRRSKRPRITPRAAYTNHIIPRPAHSPLVGFPSVHLPPQQDEEWDDSQQLFTQPPSPPPPSPPPSPHHSPSTAAPSAPSLLPQPTPIPPPPMTEFDDISHRRKSVINRACSEIFSIDNTREFQVTATHYLSYYNSAYLSMIHRTADGKSLFLCIFVLCIVRLHHYINRCDWISFSKLELVRRMCRHNRLF